MKHIFLIILTIFSFNASAKDDGLALIQRRGHLKCGTNLDIKAFAHKDKDGFWQGFDADICKSIALAVLGKENAIEIINIKEKNASKALETSKVDIIIGGLTNTVSQEATSKITPATFLYYDRLKFLAYKKENASSMQDYKGSNFCIQNKPLNIFNTQEYNAKYGLDFNFMIFNSPQEMKEAFLLKRCTVLAGSEIYLKSYINDKTVLIDEVIGDIPINIFTLKNNVSLKIAIKWIINALVFAERIDLNQINNKIYIASNNAVIQNILGQNPDVWQKLDLHPNWLRKAISLFGNYGEIYKKHIESLDIERKENNIAQKNGLIRSEMFL
ncbi:MAG: transporter substrate-binding domain-containing protein [Alphaproteobacteria bacterium]